MKYIYIALISAILFCSCQENNFVDTGKSIGVHDMSMLDYMKTDSYNWDSTVLVIERAGLESLFDGTSEEYPQITFFGPTNLSIMKYMFPKGYIKVSDIPVEDCKSLILKHVLDSRYLKEDFPVGNNNPREGGGDYETLGGNILWLYKRLEGYGPNKHVGPTHLYLESYDYKIAWDIASSDIQTNNGVVHSLGYDYIFGNI